MWISFKTLRLYSIDNLEEYFKFNDHFNKFLVIKFILNFTKIKGQLRSLIGKNLKIF